MRRRGVQAYRHRQNGEYEKCEADEVVGYSMPTAVQTLFQVVRLLISVFVVHDKLAWLVLGARFRKEGLQAFVAEPVSAYKKLHLPLFMKGYCS